MWLLLIITTILVVIVLQKLGSRATKGMQYIKQCETQYQNLIDSGISNENALLLISKMAHPELSDAVHRKIVQSMPRKTAWHVGNFIYNALDFRRFNRKEYGLELTDSEALAILKHTQISPNGSVSTN